MRTRAFLVAVAALVVIVTVSLYAAVAVTATPACIDATTGTSGTVTLGSTPSAGDTVIVGTAGFDDRTISTVVDGNGGDAAAVVVTSLDNSATFTRVSIGAFRVTTGHPDITANFSGTVTGTRVCALAVSGAANPVAFDTSSPNFGDGPEATFDTGNVTSTTADSILVAVAITSGFPGLTGDADFTNFDDTGNVLMGYKILTTTGTHSYTYTSDGGPEDGHSLLVPLQGASGAAAPAPGMMMRGVGL